MSSVSEPDSNRRTMLPGVEPTELLASLLACFRDSPRYQNIIAQDLRPRWKRAEPIVSAVVARRLPDFERISRLHQAQVFEEDEGPPCDPDLADYVEELRRFVGEKMRLARSGEPNYWSMEVVHYEVMGYLVVPPSAAMYGEELATITLRVKPSQAKIEARDASGSVVGQREFNTSRFDFDYWKLFEGEAQKLLSEQIATLREQYKRRYPEQRNRTTQDKWHREHVPALFRLLFSKPHAGDPSRATLRRLANTIGIDLPPA